MNTEEIMEALRPLINDGKVECQAALGLAAKLEIKPILIGKACNDNDIRVINCQLGCFGSGPKER